MPKPSSPQHAPRPQNWQGVKASLEECVGLLRQGKPSSAEDVARKMLEFAPMEGQAWHLLGRILQQTSRHAEALKCFTRAENCYERHQHVQDPPVSIRLAALLWNRGEHEQARAMLNILLARNPDEEALRQLRETWLQQNGQAV